MSQSGPFVLSIPGLRIYSKLVELRSSCSWRWGICTQNRAYTANHRKEITVVFTSWKSTSFQDILKISKMFEDVLEPAVIAWIGIFGACSNCMEFCSLPENGGGEPNFSMEPMLSTYPYKTGPNIHHQLRVICCWYHIHMSTHPCRYQMQMYSKWDRTGRQEHWIRFVGKSM